MVAVKSVPSGVTEGSGRHVPDILDVIAQLSSDEVPTPPLLARALLDVLPADVWTHPEYRWLNPASKYGSILQEVARRLMVSLTEWEPDPGKRAQHILTNMLYGCAITRLTGEMTRRTVYGSRDATSKHSFVPFNDADGNLPFVPAQHDYPLKGGLAAGACRVCGAPATLERGDVRENYAYAFIHGMYPTKQMNDQGMRFDVIVGNPPYQIGIEDNARARPLYQLFVDRAKQLDPQYIAMIVPSRWFTGGLGLDDFRSRMIADRHLRVIVDNPKIYDCFPDAKIRGGVNYFLWDANHDGDCTFSTRIDGRILNTVERDLRDGGGVLLRDNHAVSITAKVSGRQAGSLEKLCSPTLPFGIRDNHPSRTSRQPGDVPIVHGTRIGFVGRDELTKNRDWIDKWKVLLPRASSGDTAQDETGRIIDVVLGEPIALAGGSACTLTYVVAGSFDTRAETENYAHYLATKFVRFLVLQRKATQDIKPETFRFVPALDMSRRWTDADLYVEFGLDDEEIAHIEASIKPRTVNIDLDSAVPSSHLPGGRKYKTPGSKAAKTAEASAAEADVVVEDEVL